MWLYIYLYTNKLRYKYPSLSPYSYSANNMVNRVVLNGRDDYKVNKNGDIRNITRLKDGITHSRTVIVTNRYIFRLYERTSL